MSGADKDLFFDERIRLRLRRLDVKMVNKIVRANKEKYDNESHFYRTAILKLIREELPRLKLK